MSLALKSQTDHLVVIDHSDYYECYSKNHKFFGTVVCDINGGIFIKRRYMELCKGWNFIRRMRRKYWQQKIPSR